MNSYFLWYVGSIAAFYAVFQARLASDGVWSWIPPKRRWIAMEVTTIYAASMLIAAKLLGCATPPPKEEVQALLDAAGALHFGLALICVALAIVLRACIAPEYRARRRALTI